MLDWICDTLGISSAIEIDKTIGQLSKELQAIDTNPEAAKDLFGNPEFIRAYLKNGIQISETIKYIECIKEGNI